MIHYLQSVIPIFRLCQYMLQFIAGNVEDFWRYMPISRRYLWKKYIFLHLSRILSLQVSQRLFAITLNNLQAPVFRQR